MAKSRKPRFQDVINYIASTKTDIDFRGNIGQYHHEYQPAIERLYAGLISDHRPEELTLLVNPELGPRAVVAFEEFQRWYTNLANPPTKR